MNEKDRLFIYGIREKIKENPALIQPAIMAITSGAEDAVIEARVMAADMETVASVAMMMAGEKRVTKKAKEQFERLALSKLEKYHKKTFCNWDWAIKKKE